MDSTIENKVSRVAINLRKIREYRGYSQEYLAAKLSISQNAYSKIELGYSNMNIPKLILLSQVLDVDTACLFLEDITLSADTITC